MQKQVTIIRGLPGSGKTLYAKATFPGSLLLEGDQAFTDAYGQYDFQPKRCDPVKYVLRMLYNALMCGVPHVVITCTSPDGKAIDDYKTEANRHGYKVNLIWIDFDNGNTSLNRHAVPADVIENMKSRWVELPNETYLQRNVGETEPHFVDCKPAWFHELQLKQTKQDDVTGSHVAENKCAHCGAIGKAVHEYKEEPEEGIPAFRLCDNCELCLCEQLHQKVGPYLYRGYGSVAHTKRVALVKDFINQK